MERANLLGEIGGAAVLEQIAGGTRFERGHHMRLVAEHRDDHHIGLRQVVMRKTDQLDAAAARQPQIHQQHVWPVLRVICLRGYNFCASTGPVGGAMRERRRQRCRPLVPLPPDTT